MPYGSTFGVGTPDGNVAKAVLVAPGATTHANDMHQRLVPLAMTPTAGGLQLTAPANTSIAPPGHYMLFLVNAAGVPSVARFVHLAPTRRPRAAGPAPAAAPGHGRPGRPLPARPLRRRVTAPGATPAGTVLAPLAPRSYWSEGFENPIRGIPRAARVRAAHSGRRGLRLGAQARRPGAGACSRGPTARRLQVRGGSARLSTASAGRRVSLAARRGSRAEALAARRRHGPPERSGPVRVRLRVSGGIGGR